VIGDWNQYSITNHQSLFLVYVQIRLQDEGGSNGINPAASFAAVNASFAEAVFRVNGAEAFIPKFDVNV
jgi:hypothetical protein